MIIVRNSSEEIDDRLIILGQHINVIGNWVVNWLKILNNRENAPISIPISFCLWWRIMSSNAKCHVSISCLLLVPQYVDEARK